MHHFSVVYASERTGNLYEPRRTRLKMMTEAIRAAIIQNSIVYKTLDQDLGRLVLVSSICYHTSTSSLSTWSSTRDLNLAVRYLILREASCLDAFSTYPFQT